MMKKRIKVCGLLMITMLVTTMGFTLVQAQKQMKEAPEQVLIMNVRIFDGNSDKLAAGMNILVEDNLIKKIMGLAIFSNGIHLLLISIGYRIEGIAPILQDGQQIGAIHICASMSDLYDQLFLSVNIVAIVMIFTCVAGSRRIGIQEEYAEA